MEPLVELRFKWFDDSTLFSEDVAKLVGHALASLGITSHVAQDVFFVLLSAHQKGVGLGATHVREAVITLRRLRGDDTVLKGLTLRNIHVWLKYFCSIGLFESLADVYVFRGGKNPSKAFEDHTRPLVEGCFNYTLRLLQAVEARAGVR